MSGGSDTYANGAVTVTGAGTGIQPDGDHLHFTSMNLDAGGNFRITAHIASFNGATGASAGLMALGGTTPVQSLASVAYQPGQGSGPSPNRFEMKGRDREPGAQYGDKESANSSKLAAPCWLQLVRYGNNFAVYKSSNGKIWAQVQNYSGSAFRVSGPVQVGLFVCSGNTSTVTASFDHVTVEKNPVLPYKTSWIGDTYSSDADGFVSGGSSAMWVAPDGTCYATSFWDEGGQEGKIYKHGKVVRGFSLNAGGFEGAITSDGTHLHYFGQIGTDRNQIYQTNLTGSFDGPFQPMYLQTPILDDKGQIKMSGLAYGNGELYISDALTNQVLVANPNQTVYGAGGLSVRKTTTHPIDTSGVTNPAPQEVYQSLFETDIVQMQIPGLDPKKKYNVRMHFAEINPDDNAVGKRFETVSVGDQSKQKYDIFAAAGGLYKAAVLPFNGVAPDATGKLSVFVLRGDGSPDGWGMMSGIEILNADNSPCLAINCGGPAVGNWLPTTHELPGRAFAFTRPGPIAVDKNGNLWIVQEGATFPATLNLNTTPGWAAILLYDKNGHSLNKQITDVVNPTAITYDAKNDRLLVAENGPAQNIRFYDLFSGTDKAPVCSKTFGIPGGVFAGSTPGLAYDANAGGDARFFGPAGVGLDASDNLYVLCNNESDSTVLKSFSPDGKMRWNLQALEFCTDGDVDRTRGDSDIWMPGVHYTLNNAPDAKPGSEWKLKSYTADPFNYTFTSDQGAGSSVYRRIKGTPLMYLCGQGSLGPLYVYRFVGEQIVPCGSFTDANGGTVVWTDVNGDGVQQPWEAVMSTQDPSTKVPPPGGSQNGFDVDESGNVYLAESSVGGTNPQIKKFALQGFNAHGVPLYASAYTATPAPPPFDKEWGNKARIRYQGGPRDTMFLIGERWPQARTDRNFSGTLACYDHWSTHPVKRFILDLPDPATDPNFTCALPLGQDGFIYQAFDVANDYAFCSDLWGTIHVVSPEGKLVTNLIPGPEVNGLDGWEDEIMGVRAYYNRATGEYEIFQENSGYRSRGNYYRWKPDAATAQSGAVD